MSDEEDSDYGAPAYSPLSANSPLSDISGRLWHDTASLDDISGIDEDLVLDNEDSSTAQEMQLSPDIEESSALEVQQFANDGPLLLKNCNSPLVLMMLLKDSAMATKS